MLRTWLAVAYLGSGALPALADSPGGPPAQGARVRNLGELTGTADDHSPGLHAARHRIAAAEAQLSEAQVSPFFQLTLDTGLAYVPDARGVPGYDAQPVQIERRFGPAATASVGGAVPLWTFGKLDAARRAARSGIEAATQDRERVRQKLRYDLRRAYFALQLSLDLEQMISEGRPKLVRGREQLEAAENDGDGLEEDPQAGYRLALALAELDARSSEIQRLQAGARDALSTLTGLAQIRVPDCPLDVTVFESRDKEAYRALAVTHRPELAMLRAAIAARDAKLQATRAGYLPDIALAGRATFSYAPGRTPYEQYTPYDLTGGLVARWKLDLLGNAYRSDRAREQLAETRAQRRLAEEGVLLEVSTRHEALVDAQRKIASWAEGHRQARRWFVSAAQAYQVGTATTKQLVDGVKEYFKARYAHLQAIHDHNVALAALELSTGAQLVPEDRWEQACDGPAPQP